MFCPKCGKEIKNTAKFCNFCGEIIKENPCVFAENDSVQSAPAKIVSDIGSLSSKISNIKSQQVNKIYPLEPLAHKRMLIFALIALICTVLSKGWTMFYQHQAIQNSLETASSIKSNFFEIVFSNGTVFSNGRLFVECGEAVLISIFFFVICLYAKKCSPIVTAFPSIFSLAFTVVWAIVLTIAVKTGMIKHADSNLILLTVIEILPQIVFITVYLLSVKGIFHNSLSAKILTLLVGSVSVVYSFVLLLNYFIQIDEQIMNTFGTANIALSMVSSVFTFLSLVFGQMAMFIYVCNIRRKITEGESEVR